MQALGTITTILAAVILAGCNNTSRFVYEDQTPVPAATVKVNNTVAVIPFEDGRKDNQDFAWWLVGCIPLLPYGYADYQYPDTAKTFATIHAFSFNPCEDMAKAAATSLQRSGIFKSVVFTMHENPDADYILEGKVNSIRYSGKRFFYCISEPGAIFWLLGAPAAWSENELSFSLVMKDHSGNIVWDYSFTGQDSTCQWIYSGYTADCSMYAELMRQAMQKAITSLKQKLPSSHCSGKCHK